MSLASMNGNSAPSSSMFITIEGGEGAGKTTLAQALQQKLQKRGKKVVLTREPGGTPLGEYIREGLLENPSLSPYTDLFLFLGVRAQHINQVIRPALEKGMMVICDRFHDSTIVYQGLASGLGEVFVRDLCYQVVGKEPFLPDLTIVLDIPVKDGLARKRKQKKLDKFESRDTSFHDVIRSGFLDLAQKKPSRYLILDARASVDQLVEQVLCDPRLSDE